MPYIGIVDDNPTVEVLHKSRAVAVFQRAAQLRGVTLNEQWDTPQRMLLGDVFRISQVLNDLINNALRFTEEGSISAVQAMSGVGQDA